MKKKLDTTSHEKTNVMRILDSKKIKYKAHSYVDTDAINGLEVANALNEDPNQVFKTLVTLSVKDNQNYVFLVPVNKELDMKKAANSVNEKSITMLKSANLFDLTGYIHGGCSPIGMKKNFTTVIDSTAKNFDTIIFSAGKIGYQVELATNDLEHVISFKFDDISC